MKKILFFAVAVVAAAFVSCGNKASVEEASTIDTLGNDTVGTVVVDTLVK